MYDGTGQSGASRGSEWFAEIGERFAVKLASSLGQVDGVGATANVRAHVNVASFRR